MKKIQIIKIQKVFDSLGIRFPLKFVKDWDLKQGDYLQLEWDDNTLIIRKINKE